MLKKWEEGTPLKLKSDAKIYDIFYETKKIVYNTNKYNEYMRKTSNNKNLLPEIANNKNLSSLPVGDNFIHLSKSSLTLSKDKLFSHNTIKNVKLLGNHDDKNHVKTERVNDFDTLVIPSVLDKITNVKSRNYNNQAEGKGSFYATSLNKLASHQIKNTMGFNTSNDFYWDIKQESYFSFKKGRLETLKESLLERIKFLKENPSQNFSHSLTKTHSEGNKTSITYFLKSFLIFLRNTNMNSSFSLKNLELYIPFFLIPVIYLLDDYTLISFITYTTHFNDKFSEISFDYNKVYDFINVYFENTKKEKIKPHNHYNNLKFDWITPNIAFEASVKMPFIEIYYDSSSLKISKVLDIEITVHLHKSGFVNWDNEVINYLNQIKYFRQIINKTFSKLIQKKETGHKERSLDTNTLKDSIFTDKNIFIIFAHTDRNNINKTVTLKSYHIVAHYKKVQLLADLNFKQLSVLEKISQTYKIDDFIRKLIIINKKEPLLSFDFQYFEYIDDNFFKFYGKNNVKLETSNEILQIEVK
jgi:hypothetical protein